MLIGGVSYIALLPQLVRPPAAVPGGRVVLPLSGAWDVGVEPKRIGPPLVSGGDSFYLSQPKKGEYVAVLARWSPGPGEPACDVTTIPPFTAPVWSYSAECPEGAHVDGSPLWGPRGEPIAAPRSLARYLVSVGPDRIIVNVSDTIREYGATPQPRVAPLSTP